MHIKTTKLVKTEYPKILFGSTDEDFGDVFLCWGDDENTLNSLTRKNGTWVPDMPSPFDLRDNFTTIDDDYLLRIFYNQAINNQLI